MKRFVGIDVGGTKTAIGVVELAEGRLVERCEFPTPPRAASGRAFLDHVAATAIYLAADSGASGIGVSLCELVAPDGAVRSAHRVLWSGFDLSASFGAGRTVTVEADVRAGAVAEARLGAGRGRRDLFYVNLGTGVSSCWLRDGRPHRGARGHALLLGSGAVETVCGHCGEATSYVPEEVAGAAALVRRFNAEGGDAHSPRDVFARAAGGDERASAVTEGAAQALAMNIGLAVNILDPDAVVIGGGLAQADGAYGVSLDDRIRAHVWSPETRSLPILRATLGADSALIGAALCAADAQGMASAKSR